MKNIELKAYCSDPGGARFICESVGAELLQEQDQRDTYFKVPTGRLKLRESSVTGNCLIYYERANTPDLRESEFDLAPLPEDVTALSGVLSNALGIRVVVTKHRATFRLDSARINVDQVEDLGGFIEIEVQASSRSDPFRYASDLAERLRISAADIVPWSYSDGLSMHYAAERWREQLGPDSGRVFLLDGASGSGKTTVAEELVKNSILRLEAVPRYTTRPPRQQQADDGTYVFVSRADFEEMAATGAFMEYRDFKFGMSYACPWREASAIVLSGSNALGLINLGTGPHVKRIFPEAITILLLAPIDTIRRRLVARGVHSKSQVEERLDNARRATDYMPYYDHVIDNDDGRLDETIAALSEVIARHSEGVPNEASKRK